MQKDVNRLAILAATDPNTRDSLLREYELFILRSASKAAKYHISKSDDEWSVALMTFMRAINHYDSSKGDFLPFAEMLIHHALIDYFRVQNRHKLEIAVSPSAFDGNVEQECAETALQYAVATRAATVRDTTLKEEIEALSLVLSQYGFTFFDLTTCSPQTAKTRTACATAVNALAKDPSLMQTLWETRQLPVLKLQKITGIQRKILERHRRYIITAVEILYGDYAALAEYLPFKRKGAVE